MKLSLRQLLFFPLLLLESGCTENSISRIKDPPDEGDPRIEAAPSPVDFGVVPAGEVNSQVVTILSTGDASLNITAMQVGSGRETFSLVEPVLGTFEPGSSTDITITYTSDGSETSGDLQILSNDPANPNLRVPLLAGAEIIVDTGDSGDTDPPLSQPVAVCSVDPTEILAIHESADWIGNSSYDTDGGSIIS
jgi:hypothetical protein